MAVIRFNPAAARRGDKLALRWGTAELQLEHDVVMPTASKLHSTKQQNVAILNQVARDILSQPILALEPNTTMVSLRLKAWRDVVDTHSLLRLDLPHSVDNIILNLYDLRSSQFLSRPSRGAVTSAAPSPASWATSAIQPSMSAITATAFF
ncbi:hypothetical protein VPH35_014146 [Triticum aestivum]|uniref:Uncharacterized protein n=1 Tax=Aegilops tauschii TaxID=37682 RepID=M8B4J4_AEGTA